jgi:uncharacterized protein YbjT (DUF2867 family)
MDVLVVGGHGKVALRLLELLSERGDTARGVIRDASQSPDLEAVGAVPVVCDIETEELTGPVKGADAVVFAAGAGAGSGPERKRTVDFGGAVRLIEACRANGVSRYLMVSAIGVNNPEQWSDEMRPYYQAKGDADAHLEAAGLEHTIVRPGRLTDDEGTGLVELAPSLDRYGSIARADVAAVLAEVLGAPNTVDKAFDLIEGVTPIDEAVRSL